MVFSAVSAHGKKTQCCFSKEGGFSPSWKSLLGKEVEKTSEEGLIQLRRGMKVTRKVGESEANDALHVYVKGQISGVPSVPVMTCPLLDRAPEDAHLLLGRV